MSFSIEMKRSFGRMAVLIARIVVVKLAASSHRYLLSSKVQDSMSPTIAKVIVLP